MAKSKGEDEDGHGNEGYAVSTATTFLWLFVSIFIVSGFWI